MNITKITALATAIALASPAMAIADDNFEGPFFGGQLGLQSNGASITAPGGVQLTDTDKGFNFRGFAGYDWRVSDQFVVGAEAGIARGGSDVTALKGTANFKLDNGLTLDASVRAGFLATENILVFARGGYASSKQSLVATNSTATPASFSTNKRSGGLLLGAGAELGINENIGVRVEYRRAKMGDLKSNQFFVGALFRF